MRRKLGLPFFLPLLGLGVATLTVVMLLALAVSQPWLGLRLAPAVGGLQISGVSEAGPAAQAGLMVGEIVTHLGEVALEGRDLLTDPAVIGAGPMRERFFARQDALARALRSGAPLRLRRGEAGGEVRLLALPARAVRDVPLLFWGQIATGICGFLFGVWVLALRKDGPAETLFCLAGVGLLLSAQAAAVYSTRELALPGDTFRALWALQQLGVALVCMGLVGVFLAHPTPLVRRGWLWLPVAGFALWWLGDQLALLPEAVQGVQLPILLALAVILALVVVQLKRSREAPRARAALRWIGVAVLVGVGAFTLTSLVPWLLGQAAGPSPGAVYLFSLPIFAGLALAVARHRLFELQDWAFRILFYMGGVVLLLLLDAGLITLVALDRAPAFGIALLLVGVCYLPLREGVARWLFAPRHRRHAKLYQALTAIALTPAREEREARWHKLLREAFDPLEILPLSSDPNQVRVAEDGAVLELPALDGLPAVRLVWARGGRALFRGADLDHAAEMVAMLQGAADSRRAYESGAAEERARITRDMHDNLGVQLTGALHAAMPERKDALIRAALGDLRAILSNADQPAQDPEVMLADLRAALSDHAASVGMALEWRMELQQGRAVPPKEAHALRSVLREAVGNAIRHSGAQRIVVRVMLDDAGIGFCVEDDGRGLAPLPQAVGAESGGGQGLGNMQARIAGLGGVIGLAPRPGSGLRLTGKIPLGLGGGAGCSGS